MSNVKVKNMHSGSKDAPSGYDSWIDFWKKKKGKIGTIYCANTECDRIAEHGGHVIKVNSDDKSWYIVPLCVKCNENKDEKFIFTVDSSDLVRASQ